MKNEYRLKRIHFSVCLTKIDAVNFFFKKLGAFSCQNVRCRCQLPVLSFPSSPFDTVCKPGLLFDDVATYPKENHTTIFPFVAKKPYYNFNHLPCALPNGMGYGIYELLSSPYFFPD